MKSIIFIAAVLVVIVNGFPGVKRPAKPLTPVDASDIKPAFYFTPHLKNPQYIRDASKVVGIGNFTSYAGFYTVNQTTDNNLFIWYFPSQDGNVNAPLLIWLQGGPGGASTFGLFSEIGPFYLDAQLNLHNRPYNWNQNYSLLFIDNPVGAGFSYTGTGQGYAAHQDDVSRDLYTLLLQFYQSFPETKSVPLYITGESYAGHYIPAFGAKIYNENQQVPAAQQVNLVGISIGDGWVDPEIQLQGYPDLLFNTGLADDQQVQVMVGYTMAAVNSIRQGDYKTAFLNWDEMLNGDIYPYKSYFYNITNLQDYDNFLNVVEPESFGYSFNYLNQASVRNAIHVGNATYQDGKQCELHLLDDVMRSYKSDLGLLMNNYKVLLYNGQLDLIVGVPLTELYLPTIPWFGANDFTNANRTIWRINPDDEYICGYVRKAHQFAYVVLRLAGHIVPYDQPAASYDLITRFVNNNL